MQLGGCAQGGVFEHLSPEVCEGLKKHFKEAVLAQQHGSRRDLSRLANAGLYAHSYGDNPDPDTIELTKTNVSAFTSGWSDSWSQSASFRKSA